MAPFASLLPFHTEQSKSVVSSPLPICAQLVKLSTHQMTYFNLCFLQNTQNKFTFSSSQSALWNNGADNVASHPEASALLQSLNLPQHTGTFVVELTYLCLVSASVLTFHPVWEMCYVQSFPFPHSKTRVLSFTNRQHQRAHLRCVLPLSTAGGRPAP